MCYDTVEIIKSPTLQPLQSTGQFYTVTAVICLGSPKCNVPREEHGEDGQRGHSGMSTVRESVVVSD